jgi:hypothetical protein
MKIGGFSSDGAIGAPNSPRRMTGSAAILLDIEVSHLI